MSVYYFHCTDGVDLIIDRCGREPSESGGMAASARRVADDIKRAVPSYREWADWAVHVYDERGQVDIIPFDEASPSR